MGKRNRAKQNKQQKTSESSSTASDTADLPEMSHSLLFESFHTNSNTPIILQDLRISIKGIYKQYLSDLEIRKQKRLSLKIPTIETQHYNLVINSNYLTLLQSKVHEVLINQYSCSLKHIIDETLEYFINKLENYVQEAEDKSKLLQSVYFNEAYHSLKNSVSQVSKIIKELYKKIEFNKICMTKFYENIMIRHKKLLAFAKSQDSSHFAIEFIQDIYDEYEFFVKTGDFKAKCLLVEDLSDIEESPEEPLHSLPLDDLLKYINGNAANKKGKKKNNAELANKNELDDEIIDFENRLSGTKPCTNKPIPYCSFEFLKKINDRYLQVRKTLRF